VLNDPHLLSPSVTYREPQSHTRVTLHDLVVWSAPPRRKDCHFANIQPNRFVLQSSNGVLKVDYETTGFLGQPFLNLTEGSDPTRHFSGFQIRRLNTEIGTLVTVTTRMTIDTGATSFSVLIPAITLTGTSDHKTFTTEAIVTTHTGPNSVPVTGVHETYQFVEMKGETRFVFAVFEPVMAGYAKGGTA